MSNFNIDELFNLPLNKNETSKILKLYRKKNKKMDLDDIRQINNMFRNKLDGDKFYLRVKGIHGYFTPKTVGNQLNLDDIEDYTQGKVRDNTKFSDEFFYVEVGFVSKNKK
jgi:hypothetical protein